MNLIMKVILRVDRIKNSYHIRIDSINIFVYLYDIAYKLNRELLYYVKKV